MRSIERRQCILHRTAGLDTKALCSFVTTAYLLLTVTVGSHAQSHPKQTCTIAYDGTSACKESSNDDDVNRQAINAGMTVSSALSDSTCGLYLAPSTIPGAGVGIFTAVEKQIGDTVGRGDICIPVIDMYWHADGITQPFSDYFWSGDTMGMSHETDSDDVEALCPGLDCAINCHLALVNVEKAVPVYDDFGALHRSRDPGTGAFSPYHNGTTYVSRHIPAGGELFKFYGDHWFQTRPHVFGLIPLSEDYETAEDMNEKMVLLLQRALGTRDGVNVSSGNNLLEDWFGLLQKINAGAFESRTLNALPQSWADATLAAKDTISALHQPSATRDVAWLEKHGRCIDHVEPRTSTIVPQAGRGAFAVRSLLRDQVITTTPLLHVADADFFNLYNVTSMFDENDNEHYQKHVDTVVGSQILLNYCFGHEETTVILCPYGSGINYINHDATLANVKIRWAVDFDVVHDDEVVQSWTVEDLENDTKPRLALDYFATRNIEPGEELFLDYGAVWEEAWREHVDTWQPYNGVVDAISYGSATTMNEVARETPLRTQDEQRFDPYPGNLQIRCHYALKNTINREEAYVFHWRDTDYGYACHILDRFIEDNKDWYTVELELTVDSDAESAVRAERTDVPRSAMQFFPAPGTSDLQLPNAFRHVIGLPDELLPPQWRNV